MNAIIQFLKNADDYINPIAVKELRQSVRSRYIIVLLQMYLVIQALIVGWFFLFTDQETISNGSGLFTALVALLFITCVICVPVYTSIRLTNEMRDVDLMFSTSLTPMQTMRGKFEGGVILSLLLFSAAAPFLSLTYLMRGLDLSTIFVYIYLSFFTIQTLNCFALLFGTLKLQPAIRIIIGCFFGFLLLSFLSGIVSSSLLSVSTFSNTYEFITFLIFSFLGYFFLGGSMLLLAACAISPETSSRMTRIRIFIAICIVLAYLVGGIYAWLESNHEPILVAEIFSFLSIAIFACVGICERTRRSVRQIRQIPQNFLLKILAYPLFTGAGSALAWCFFMLIAVLSIDTFTNPDSIISGIWTGEKDVMSLAFFVLFCIAYGAAGFGLKLRFDLWRRETYKQPLPDMPSVYIYPKPLGGAWSWAFSLGLLILASMLPGVLYYFATGKNFIELSASSTCYIFNPFFYAGNYSDALEYGVIPLLLGAFGIVFLVCYCIFDFIKYCRNE